jgi:hypothetical protein
MNIGHQTDKYMGLVKVKPDGHIFIDFRTNEYNLNILVGIDELKNDK